MPLTVSEIFFSLQGESSFAGLPCAFVRLTGCNLRCSYCDTTYAYEGGVDFSIREILDHVGTYGVRLVEVTGGEPLLQSECPDLIRSLLGEGYAVLIETNGSQDIRRLPEGCVCILDLKCPSSGMTDRMDFGNLPNLRKQDEVKFVVQNRLDYDWAKLVLEQHAERLSSKVLFSPAHPHLSGRDLAEWILSDSLQVRLQIPLHRLLWPEATRGR